MIRKIKRGNKTLLISKQPNIYKNLNWGVEIDGVPTKEEKINYLKKIMKTVTKRGRFPPIGAFMGIARDIGINEEEYFLCAKEVFQPFLKTEEAKKNWEDDVKKIIEEKYRAKILSYYG